MTCEAIPFIMLLPFILHDFLPTPSALLFSYTLCPAFFLTYLARDVTTGEHTTPPLRDACSGEKRPSV